MLGKPPVPGAARRMRVLQAGGMTMARALYAQRTLLRLPQAARGKAPLAYALQAQRAKCHDSDTSLCDEGGAADRA